MIIDAPRPEDISRLRQLWQEAFGDSDDFLDGFFSRGYSPARCRCLWLQDRLAAALYWFDCTWQGKKLAYIYAVATGKAYRGRGLCTALMGNTHRHLQSLGYTGAALVPAGEKLVSLYAKLGYRPFGPMAKTVVEAAGMEVVKVLDPATFCALRRRFLPENGILQEGATLAYLQTFTGFYAGEGFLACATTEGDTAYFQEYLGDPARLPGLTAALGAKKAVVYLPGEGERTAMYYPLTEETEIPGYLGLSLG